MIYLLLIVSSLLSPFTSEKGGYKDGKYVLNLESSKITWSGTAAFGVGGHTGTIQPESGHIAVLDGSMPAIHLAIDVTSLDGGDEKLNGHLKSPDFFDTAKYPDAAFVLEKPITAENGGHTLTGLVTIKGVSAEESFKVEFDGTKYTLTCTFDITLDRTKYGVNYNSPNIFKGLKDGAISDEIGIKGVLVFER